MSDLTSMRSGSFAERLASRYNSGNAVAFMTRSSVVLRQWTNECAASISLSTRSGRTASSSAFHDISITRYLDRVMSGYGSCEPS